MSGEKNGKAAERLLELDGVAVGFPMRRHEMSVVTHGVSFHVDRGEALGIVGESGSGKSVSMLAALGLLGNGGRVVEGSIRFYPGDGSSLELNHLTEKELCAVRGDDISMIFQEPMTSLNPVMTIGAQVEEMLLLHDDAPKEARRERVLAMLGEAGLSGVEELYEKYPHELSGGMRQRVMIAMAMLLRPRLLIADEPTTALDVTIQAKILALLKKFQEEYGTTIILISHDLGVIRSVCSRAVVMCAGEVVEQGRVEELFEHPQQEYTKRLLAAALGKGSVLQRESAPGEQMAAVVRDYSVYYEERAKKLFAAREKREVVKGVSFDVREGEIVGIVGESGCGKSTLAKAMAGLNPLTAGELTLACSRPQMVFQDPYGSLNPAKTIGWLLTEPLRIGRVGTREERRARACEMLRKVGLEEEYYDRYPGTLSGGQRQRVAIAMALMLRQKLILLDEPVSALDVTVQEQILILLVGLQKEFGLSYLFISHDMNVIHRLCDRVLVMYRGEIVESGSTDEVFRNPQHEYTKKLLEARL
ncbi:MAG: ABC transporter ATP-binding protein [Lachnospiraceae bacterium]|nr:ABC transporter ATP-binding protein [Lachnospiraceae bacterium]